MYGTNPLRGPEKGDGSTLLVKRIFPTLQGEGPNAGCPAVFVRLGGCNLACDFCDTDFEDFQAMTLADILQRVNALAGGDNGKRLRELIVITGGEPLRQSIAPLCEQLLAAGYRVQIETNGTLYRELPEGVEIVCSPKHSGQGYYPLRPDLASRVTALKFLVSAHRADYRDIAHVGQGKSVPVYVQPMDENDEAKNRANWQYAAQLAAENGYRLSMQMHKLLGIE